MEGLLKKHPKVSILLVTILAVLFILGYFVRGGLSQTSANANESKVVQQPVTVVQEETKKEPALEKQKTDELQKQAPAPADTQTPSNEQKVTTSAVKATTADATKVQSKQAPEEPKKDVEPQSQPQPPAEVKQPKDSEQTQSQPIAEVKQPEAPKAIDNTNYLPLIQAKDPRFVYPPKGRNVLGYSDKDWVRQVVVGNISTDRFPNRYQLEICQLLPENFDLAKTTLAIFIGDNNANEIIGIVKKFGNGESPKEKDYDGKTIVYYSEVNHVYILIYCNGLQR
jgi:hypothetical protein